MIRFDHHAQFITVTNLNWLPVLQNDYHKQILIEALKHRVSKQEVSIYAFVIMPNHFHVIWQLHDGINKAAFQRDLLKFTARSILKFMLMNDDPLLIQLKVKAAEVQYAYDLMQWCDQFSLILCLDDLPAGQRALEISKGPDGRRPPKHRHKATFLLPTRD